MKLKTLSTNFNSIETAYLETLDNSKLHERNSRNKFTQRKHWIETNKKGEGRYCAASFDSYRNVWCNPKKGTYSIFMAMVILNNEVRTISLSRYFEPDHVDKLLEKYDFQLNQISKLKTMRDLKAKAQKKYDEITQDAEERFKETRKELGHYKFNNPYSIDEINKCSTNMLLLKIYVAGYGVKKRCRKEEYFNDRLFYVLPTPDTSLKDIGKEVLFDHTTIALSHLKTKYRSISKAHFSAKKVEYQAAEGDSRFYGMREMLMSDPEYSINLLPVEA